MTKRSEVEMTIHGIPLTLVVYCNESNEIDWDILTDEDSDRIMLMSHYSLLFEAEAKDIASGF
jgi:hypothetical protein